MKSSLTPVLLSTLLTLLTLLPTANTTSISPLQPRASCATGVHIITARASTEAPGTGIIGAVANDISSQVPGSDIAAVDYPATISSVQNYAWSESQGVIAMTQMVQAYVQMCPSTKIVLLGYSQGGEVVGDVLCGSSETISPQTAPLATVYGNQILAAITMGSPAHITGLPWDVGTSTNSGIFPRLNTTACLPYTNRLQEYCDTDDYYCASGTNAGSVHTGYVARYGGVAAGYVVAKAKAAGLTTVAPTLARAAPASSGAGAVAGAGD